MLRRPAATKPTTLDREVPEEVLPKMSNLEPGPFGPGSFFAGPRGSVVRQSTREYPVTLLNRFNFAERLGAPPFAAFADCRVREAY